MKGALRIAQRLAEKSPCAFRHASIVVRNGNILSTGFNHGGLHAEESALGSLRLGDRARGAVLYSFRFTKLNALGMAKPCPNCAKLIREAGVKKVYYSTPNGLFSYLVI